MLIYNVSTEVNIHYMLIYNVSTEVINYTLNSNYSCKYQNLNN